MTTRAEEIAGEGPYTAYQSAVDPHCWLVRFGTVGPVYEYATPIQAGNACDALNAAYAAGQAAQLSPKVEGEQTGVSVDTVIDIRAAIVHLMGIGVTVPTTEEILTYMATTPEPDEH